ncbi:taurine ABC transporter substrate-binding protein [Enterococcus dongliensis]|uniref:taurine ABC transporter substrate-binding protein n=1 Tax=Enterococcus dongliensis TaxID=2559925 RepID=UPI00288D5DB9|nr:ABC transporter substrate-binding protein [Enterococcus dongliensis]MDT2613790.1 ABC transporter substrate-binding protein [Enterococcus dongliensis]
MLKKFLRFLVIVGVTLTLTACTSAKKSTTSMKVIRIGILRVPNDVAATRQMKILKKACAQNGYKVKYITFDSGVDANKALLSNSVDLATMGDTNAVVAMAAAIPAKLVWINDVIGNNEALVVKKKLGIRQAQDLRGLKIATPFASTSHYSLMMYLQQQHLTDQVTLVDMQTPEIVAAWQRDDIDGAYTWQPSLDSLHASTTLVSSDQLAERGALTANVTLVTNKFAQQHAEILRQILSTLGTAHTLYQQQPQKIYQLTAQQMNITSNEAKQQIGTSSWLPSDQLVQFMNTEFAKQFYQTSQFMYQRQTLNSRPNLQQIQQFIDTQFIIEGKTR